jgi:hypothetical protein
MIITENRHVEYGCLMALPPIEYCQKMVNLAKTIIPSKNLYTDPNDPRSYGYTDKDFHCTIKYGFSPDLLKVDVARILNGLEPFNIKFTALNLFNNENYDVVKFEVEKSEMLGELRRRCDLYKNEDKYPTYNPHSTLAYVKKGSFPHIREKLNITLPVTRFKYSGKTGSYFVDLQSCGYRPQKYD